MSNSPQYRWQYPAEWLPHVVNHRWDAEKIACEFLRLVQTTDSDTLQDMYESEMDDDGYFNTL